MCEYIKGLVNINEINIDICYLRLILYRLLWHLWKLSKQHVPYVTKLSTIA